MPYLIPDTESPSLAIIGSHMCHILSQTQSHHRLLLWGHTCHILSQTQSHHRLLLWGHTCAVSYPRHRVTIACYYGVTHVPYLIPDTESPSLAIMGSHICRVLSQTHSQHRGGGALNFFSGRGVRPGFPKCGACKLTFVSEKGGL